MLITILYFLIAFGALWQAYRDPQVSFAFLSQNATAMMFFAVFIAVGLLAIQELLPRSYGGFGGLLLIGVFLSWAMLGCLWMLRKIPRDDPPPGWVLYPWSVVDKALVWTAFLCGLALLVR